TLVRPRPDVVPAGDDLAHAGDLHAEGVRDRVRLDPRLLDREPHRLGARTSIVARAERDALQLIGARADAGVDHRADRRELDDLDADDVARPIADDTRLLRLAARSEEHTSELQSRENLVCRLLLEKKNNMLHRAPSKVQS